MTAYIVALVFVLSFATAMSIAWYDAGFPGAGNVLMIKDAMLGIGIGLCCAFRMLKWRQKHFKMNKFDLLVGTLLAINLCSFMLSPADPSLRLINLRRNVSLFCFLWVCYFLVRSQRQVKTFVRSSYLCFVVIGCFGITEYCLPDAFWDRIVNIPAYWGILADPFSSTTIRENGRFYTYDFYQLIHSDLRRLVSFYTEPTTLAAFLVFMYCLSYVRGGRMARIGIFILGALTISKFFLVAVFLIAAMARFRDRIPRNLMVICYTGCVVISVAGIALDANRGAFAHLNGVISLYQLVATNKVLGFGLGAAGNYAEDGSAAGDLGAESGLGNVAAQLGIGVFVYLFVFNSLFKELHKRWAVYQRREYLIGMMMLASWVVSFFLSASSLGLSGNAFFFMYIGSVLGMNPQSTDEKTLIPYTLNPVPA